MKITFKETQKFNQWWLWLIIIGIGLMPIFGIYKQLYLGEQFGSNPMSDMGLVVFCIFNFALIALFLFMKLTTEIDETEIRMSFFPFVKKRILWKDVKTAEIVNYGFVGYGIRIGSKHGTVYNTNGKMGLAIVMQNGKKFLIGTQKETELDGIVKRILEQRNLG